MWRINKTSILYFYDDKIYSIYQTVKHIHNYVCKPPYNLDTIQSNLIQ